MGQLSVLGSIFYYVFSFGAASLLYKSRIRSKTLKILCIIALPVILSTFRHNVGNDYGSYITGYYNMYRVSYASILKSYHFGDEILFALLVKFTTSFRSERAYLFIISLVTILPATLYFYRQWDDLRIQPMIMFVYLFSPYVFSLSAIRQGIALSFLIYSLTYVYDRKPVQFAACVLIASLFHSTAWAFLPVYFFLNMRRKLTPIKRILIIIACVLIISNLKLVSSLFIEGKYEIYTVQEVEGRNRTFWLYMLTSFVFLVFRKKLLVIDERNELLIMLFFIGAMCQYLGFSNAFSKRIGDYFVVAQIFLLPQIPLLFNSRSRKIVRNLVVLYVIALFIAANPISYHGMAFIPYKYKLW